MSFQQPNLLLDKPIIFDYIARNSSDKKRICFEAWIFFEFLRYLYCFIPKFTKLIANIKVEYGIKNLTNGFLDNKPIDATIIYPSLFPRFSLCGNHECAE